MASRFVKVPGSMLLKPNDAAADIHAADLSDLLGRFGIDLTAEKIESETTDPIGRSARSRPKCRVRRLISAGM